MKDLQLLAKPFDLSDLEWRGIDGVPYEVNAHGQVRRTKESGNASAGSLLVPVVNPVTGYAMVNLYDGRGRTHVRHRLVHRLVAKAFIPNPDGRPQVNHLNGLRSDNRSENLEWVTAAENNAHARSKWPPSYATGAQVHTTKMNPVAVLVIRYMAARGTSHRALGRAYSVDHKTIGAIVHRKTWRHA